MSEKKVKIMFSVSERTKADFKIRLQYDSLTQVKFFNSIMEGYLQKDEDLMKYMNKFKKNNTIQNNEQRIKIEKNIQKAKETKIKFYFCFLCFLDIFFYFYSLFVILNCIVFLKFIHILHQIFIFLKITLHNRIKKFNLRQ